MKPTQLALLLGLFLCNAGHAGDLLPGLSDNVACYQNGTQILKTQNRIREFTPSESMKLLVQVKQGEASDTQIRVYASAIGDVTCVVTVQK